MKIPDSSTQNPQLIFKKRRSIDSFRSANQIPIHSTIDISKSYRPTATSTVGHESKFKSNRPPMNPTSSQLLLLAHPTSSLQFSSLSAKNPACKKPARSLPPSIVFPITAEESPTTTKFSPSDRILAAASSLQKNTFVQRHLLIAT
ncbi:unnamed protein product [Linum trigynum]|uniref:Uncharacterized protein n=1 Tax=Linum trigynum TaxID=586398 RepID=A0AAV2F9K1_9ROSI